MTTYRSKPTTVEATRWDGRNTEAVIRWIAAKAPGEVVFGVGCLFGNAEADTRPRLMIGPFDDAELVEPGDWIVWSVAGSFEAVPEAVFALNFVIDGDGDAA